jgi:hypothetical protein
MTIYVLAAAIGIAFVAAAAVSMWLELHVR